MTLPRPHGASLSVLGSFAEPGLYVVELSARLGVVVEWQQPMYVPTAALVTNLSVHFKKGRHVINCQVTTPTETRGGGRPMSAASRG
jgi:hypothetical protein